MNNQSSPSAQCAEFAPLLSVLDEPGLDPQRVAEARRHLRTCAHCQAQVRLDAAIASDLRRRFVATPTYATEDIMRSLFARDHAAAPAAAHTAAPASGAPTSPPAHAGDRARPPSRARSVFSGIAAVAVVALLIVFAQVLFHAGTPGSSGGSHGPLVVSLPGTQGWLADVSMVTPTDGWAIGFVSKTAAGNTPAQTAALYHYDGTTWTPTFVPVGIPTSGNVVMSGAISMDSATDGWAAGSNNRGGNFVLHFTGGAWQRVATSFKNDIWHIQAQSPRSVWVATIASSNQSDVLYRFDGTAWQMQNLASAIGPDAQITFIYGFQMVSATEGWAQVQTNNGNGGMAFLHDQNGQWALSGSVYATVTAAGLAMDSATDGWAIANEVAPINGDTYRVPYKQLIYHYTNGQWQPVSVPVSQSDDVQLGGTATNLSGAVQPIVAPSAAEGWIAGFTHSTLTGQTIASISQTIVLLHLVNGQWQRVTPPATNASNDGINAFAFTSSADGWAVGYETSGTVASPLDLSSLRPLLLHYQDGAWSVYQQS
jgi:hypothetical protein